MKPAHKRALVLLGVIGVFECVAVGFLFAYPARKAQAPRSNHEAISMELTSSAFAPQSSIPSLYTCEGENVHPPLTIANLPAGTVSIAVLMDDPDVPKVLRPDGVFDHFVLYNVPVPQGSTTLTITPDKPVGVLGVNTAGKASYAGPCPPVQYEPREHRYVFVAYALDTMLTFEAPPTKDELLQVLPVHTLGSAELVGRYQKIHTN